MAAENKLHKTADTQREEAKGKEIRNVELSDMQQRIVVKKDRKI